MQEWEYRIFDVDTGLFGSSDVPEEELNELGAEGWEVAAPITQNSGQTAALVLKRPR